MPAPPPTSSTTAADLFRTAASPGGPCSWADRTLKHKGGATPVALAVNQAEWAKGAAKPAVVLPPGARYHLGKIICAHLESKTPDPDGAPKKRARASFAEPAPKPHFSLP